ncbi:hypothetical protein [Streptomyces sp. ADI92-24]|uniref:hypothetical protein n=1 Tax=Streptomyces sp. ADI92-24 TaxID=1522756 RepID=UPI001F152C70|nr:hypothetical protein [Streptomyces sp. ADI92-24]
MKVSARTIDAVNDVVRFFLGQLDQLHSGLFFLVVPLFVIVVGAAAVALLAIAAAFTVVAAAIGVILVARRGINAAAAHSSARAVTT